MERVACKNVFASHGTTGIALGRESCISGYRCLPAIASGTRERFCSDLLRSDLLFLSFECMRECLQRLVGGRYPDRRQSCLSARFVTS